MDEALMLRSAAAADLVRLRAFAARAGASGVLEAHVGRPRYRPQLTRVAERDGELVGCALIAHRRLRLGAATLDVGVLEAIVPRPDSRLTEVSHALLGEYLGTLYEQDLPLAALCGHADQYTPFGFAPYLLRSRVTLPQVDAVVVDRTAGAPALTLAAEADLEDLAALYEVSYASVPLSEARAKPDWRALLTAPGELLALRDVRGRTAAYARLVPLLDNLVVTECGAADSGAARGLLAALGPRGVGELWLAPGHIVAQAGLHLGGELRLSAPPAEAPLALAGVVDLPGVLSALVPELERRLATSRYAGWGGEVRLELEQSRATLLLECGRATVVDGTRPAAVRLRRVTLSAVAQLLLGYRGASDLRATGGLDCDDTALSLVDVLFPFLGACGDGNVLYT